MKASKRLVVLKKDSSFDLGPPRNARKWQQAKEYAESMGRGGDWPYLLQVYNMLALLPAYKSTQAATQKAEEASHRPPQGVRDACRRGLELRSDHGGAGLTPAAVAWARRIAAGQPVSAAKIAKMSAFFARHAGDKKPGWGAGKPTPGFVSWQLWGGDPGRAWAAKMQRRLEKANIGRKKKNGQREGCWAYARRVAKERGKDDKYAAAVAARITGKASKGFTGTINHLAVDWTPAKNSLFAAPISEGRSQTRLRVTPGLDRLASGASVTAPPDRMIVDIDDAVRDLPLDAEKRKRLADGLRAAVKISGPRHSSQEALRSVLRDHGRGLHPAVAQRFAHRVQYLQLSNARKSLMPLSINKSAMAPKYVKRERKGDRWVYTYADGAGSGSAHAARAHAEESAMQRAKAEEYAAAGKHDLATTAMQAAQHHQDQSNHYARQTALQNGGKERMASAEEQEHAARAPGVSDKRMLTPAESGRLAVTPKVKKHPWEKSVKRKQDIRKGLNDGVTQAFDSSGDTFDFLGGLQPFGYARIDSDTGAQIDTDANSFDELAQIMADFDGATQRGQVVAELTNKQPPDLAQLPPQNPLIDVSGNAPADIPDATVSAVPEEGGDVMTKSGHFLERSHEAAASEASFINLPLYHFVPSPDIERDERFVYVGRA